MTIILTEINRRLAATASAMCKADHEYCFECADISNSVSVQHSLTNGLPADHNWDVESEASTWGQMTRELARWLESDVLSCEIESLFGQVMLPAETIVTRVRVVSRDGLFLHPWYEASWSDFVMENGKRKWLLHLGVSD